MFKDNYSVKTNLKGLFMQQYERYLPTAFDESMTILEKMNKLIESHNAIIDVVNTHVEFTSDQLERAFGIIDENIAKQLKQFRDELEEQTTLYEELRDQMYGDLLPDTVKQKLEEWLLNGTIKELIEDSVFPEWVERLYTVENEFDEFKENVKNNIGFYIEDFWNEQDTDWSNAFNRANAELKEGQTVILEGGKHYLITETVVFDKLINIKGNNATIEYSGSGKALKYGDEVKNTPPKNEYGVYTRWENFTLTNNQEVDHALLGGDTTSNGLELVNIIQCEFSNILVHNFHTNIILKGINSKGCQTNRFYNLRSVDGLINIKFVAENNGWVNENTFFGGHFTSGAPNDTGLTDQAIVISMTETDKHSFNHNHFHNINVENRWSGKVLDCNGTDNTFNNLRWEGTKPRAIIFGEDSQKNIIFGGFGFGGLDSAKLSDNGKGNTFITGHGRSSFSAGNSFGVIQGTNRTNSEDGGKAKFPVFSTMYNDDKTKLSVAHGHQGIGLFRKDRVDRPGIWIDSETSQIKMGNGTFTTEDLPYLHSTSRRHIEVNNNFDEVAFKIGDPSKPAFLTLGGKHLWLDDNDNLRLATSLPNDFNSDGRILASPNS